VEFEQNSLPPPPGLIATLAAGFNSVANSIVLILPPVLLDLLLWFGPRLSVQAIFQPLLDAMPRLYANWMPAETLEAAHAFWMDLFSRFNLFVILRTFPVGIPSLLVLEMPIVSPLGRPLTVEIDSFLALVGISALLAFLGWILGGLYFQWVATATLGRRPPAAVWKFAFQAASVNFLWTLALFLFGFPTMSLLGLIMMKSPAFSQFLLTLISMFFVWLLVPLYFSAHGIFVFQWDALHSILNSLRLVRFTFPVTSFFLLLMALISFGLRFLWQTPPADSWWTLVGIMAHAFISTSLLAASFIYYRDVNNWLELVFQRLKAKMNTVKG
jgi:hypothetical protein